MNSFFDDIAVIWRNETVRAVKSGRAIVMLVLFVMFVGIGLALAGYANHQINAMGSGADPAAVLDQKRKFLGMFVSDDSRLVESLLGLPLALLIVFKVTVWFIPALVALMGFDQVSGELGPKSIRYLVVRTDRSAIVLGKLFSQLTIFAVLLTVTTALMVGVTKLLNADFSSADASLWLLKLVVSTLVLSLAYLALTGLCSTLFRQPALSLVVNLMAVFVIWFVAILGDLFILPGDASSSGGALAQLKSESPWAFLRYLSVWFFRQDLLHPNVLSWLVAVLMHVGYGLVFLGLAQLVLKWRDV